MVNSPRFALITAIAVGCTADPVVIPQSDEIFAAVVISPDAAAPSATKLSAFLLRAGTPLRSPYLVATRFEMRRASDGALFDWRTVAQPDTAVGNGSEFLRYSQGNYELPRVGFGGLLGRQDIRPGDTYNLLIEVDGRLLTGVVTVPGMPAILRSPALTIADSVVWRSATGAVGYSIVTQDFFPLSDFTVDTVYRFSSRLDNTSSKGTTVRAYEAQLFSYLTDRHVGRAGLSAGLGVFGAYNADSLPARFGR
jgi:hypothetical protein